MDSQMEPGQGFAGGSAKYGSQHAAPAMGDHADNRIEMELPAGPDAAAAARNALLALDGGVGEEVLNDARLLVSELVTNSVRHSDAGRRATVQMQVLVSESTLHIEVADGGTGFEPKPRDADRTRPGGWGLYLVDQLADRWGVATDRLTRVWFEMDQGGKSRDTREVAA